MYHFHQFFRRNRTKTTPNKNNIRSHGKIIRHRKNNSRYLDTCTYLLQYLYVVPKTQTNNKYAQQERTPYTQQEITSRSAWFGAGQFGKTPPPELLTNTDIPSNFHPLPPTTVVDPTHLVLLLYALYHHRRSFSSCVICSTAIGLAASLAWRMLAAVISQERQACMNVSPPLTTSSNYLPPILAATVQPRVSTINISGLSRVDATGSKATRVLLSAGRAIQLSHRRPLCTYFPLNTQLRHAANRDPQQGDRRIWLPVHAAHLSVGSRCNGWDGGARPRPQQHTRGRAISARSDIWNFKHPTVLTNLHGVVIALLVLENPRPTVGGLPDSCTNHVLEPTLFKLASICGCKILSHNPPGNTSSTCGPSEAIACLNRTLPTMKYRVLRLPPLFRRLFPGDARTRYSLYFRHTSYNIAVHTHQISAPKVSPALSFHSYAPQQTRAPLLRNPSASVHNRLHFLYLLRSTAALADPQTVVGSTTG